MFSISIINIASIKIFFLFLVNLFFKKVRLYKCKVLNTSTSHINHFLLFKSLQLGSNQKCVVLKVERIILIFSKDTYKKIGSYFLKVKAVTCRHIKAGVEQVSLVVNRVE